MNTKIDSFELLDGSILEGYPIVCPSIPESNELQFDTTGQYLSLDHKPEKTSKEKEKERQRGHSLFYENIPLFLANTDRILGDSRLFLAVVPVQNGLAYTGTSGFQQPTLGIYIEGGFIIRIAPSYSKGRPIWFISGSPLSGSHACSSVDSKGKTHKSVLNGRFRDVWRSFVEVNTRYDEAKSRFMAYSLEEVISLLNEKTCTD